jgi:hypothetical protein
MDMQYLRSGFKQTIIQSKNEWTAMSHDPELNSAKIIIADPVNTNLKDSFLKCLQKLVYRDVMRSCVVDIGWPIGAFQVETLRCGDIVTPAKLPYEYITRTQAHN